MSEREQPAPEPAEKQPRDNAKPPDPPEGAPGQGPREGDATPDAPVDWSASLDTNRGKAVQAGRIDGGVHFTTYVDSEESSRRVRRAMRVDEAKVATIRSTFVAQNDDAYDRFINRLQKERVGFIVGVPGRGRGTTGIHALDRVGNSATIQEEAVDPEERDGGLSGISVEKGRAYLLDLTHVPRLKPEQKAGLRSFARSVRSDRALLVVIATEQHWLEDPSEGYAWLEITEPSDSRQVFAASMGYWTSEDDAKRWLADSTICALLEEGDCSAATRLAATASRAEPGMAEKSELLYPSWINAVLDSFRNPTTELTGLFTGYELDKEFKRLLVGIVAILENAPTTAISAQAHRLAEQWMIASQWRTPISGDGLTQLLETIGAVVDGDRVRFRNSQRAATALAYLWQEYPEVRRRLLDWSADAAEDLDWDCRVGIADRWLGLALRIRDPAPVKALLERWGSSPSLMWAAIPTIAEAAVTPEIGGVIRSRLYEIACSSNYSRKDRSVTEICRLYGRAQPRTALTRLRWIAAKIPSAWPGSVLKAVEDIADEPGNLAITLEELTTWLHPPTTPGRIAVTCQALTRLLTRRGEHGWPISFDALIRDDLPIGACVDAWQASRNDPGETRRALWAWFDAMSARRAQLQLPLDVLYAAAKEDRPLAELITRTIVQWRLANSRTLPELAELHRAITAAMSTSSN